MTATSANSKSVGGVGRPPRLRPRGSYFGWIGILPFLLFSTAFLLGPAAILFYRSFRGNEGGFTFANYQQLTDPQVLQSYGLSVRISLVTAVVGGVFGFLLAWAVIFGGLPRFFRSLLTTFSGVASNFAGVPLAAAFIFTLGRIGLVTALFGFFGLELYQTDFSLYNFWGLTVVYMFFQFPLMVLTITPALEGLKKEWREASENLGASSWEYWRYIALPVLMPSVLGTIILLFGNAFGAHATAYALTGGTLRLATILIGAQISGDVLQNQGLGYAVAMGMVVIMGFSIAVYTVLQRRAERWLG
ncbi:MAG TPA: ABC transporter permease subunit [Acidimicrobiia bacterium]|nr:ABC transporter permease subunit [Acidimicrobiia bacterium]